MWVIKGFIDNSHTGSTSLLVDQVSSDPQYFDTRNIPIVQARSAYKACGKEPSRYRPSAEALRRRIKSGKGLYKISPAVDIINIISIKSGISIGGYDYQNIFAPIQLIIGGKDPYEAVGRGLLNIEYLPSLCDVNGPFGSPTSDSTRTMINKGTTELMMVFFDFGGYKDSGLFVEEAKTLLENYCNLSSQYVGPL